MLYTDGAVVVSQSPEHLRIMMGVIEVACAAFGLTVSEESPEITCLRTEGMPEAIAIFNVEVADQVYNQTNEFIHLRGNVNHNMPIFPSTSTGTYVTHGASGSTPLNCTTDRALPLRSNFGWYEPRCLRRRWTAA